MNRLIHWHFKSLKSYTIEILISGNFNYLIIPFEHNGPQNLILSLLLTLDHMLHRVIQWHFKTLKSYTIEILISGNFNYLIIPFEQFTGTLRG